MKILCIADTCSLIYLSNTDVRIGNKEIYKWLWDEFNVRYSQTVLDEIVRHRNQIAGKYNYNKFVWGGNFTSDEKKLFGNALERIIENSTCPHCKEKIMRRHTFFADLTTTDDRGERHNCCVALDAVRDFSQVIYLTDDHKATRDYVNHLFNTMPLGVIWSSMDFALYLFSKHKNRISLDETIEVLRSINAQDHSIGSAKSMFRLNSYIEKARKIQKLLS